MKTLVGLYDTREGARETIEDLVDAAFSREQISMATQHTRRDVSDVAPDDEPGDDSDDSSVLSGLSSLLTGLGTLAVPGLGIIVAAGPLAGLLTGALAGGVADGLVVGLIGLGIPRDQAEAYTEGIRRGGTLVVAQIEDDGLEEAQSIMQRRNPIDIERRSQGLQDIVWEDDSAGAQSQDEREGPSERHHVSKERDVAYAPVSTRTVEDSEDWVRSYRVSEPVAEQVLFRHESMDLDQDLEKRDFSIGEDGEEVIELREIEEKIVVEKVPRVVGQVRITRDTQVESESVHETARRADVEVERWDEDEGVQESRGYRAESEDLDFHGYEPIFRQHYKRTLMDSGNDFAFYRAAYIFGCRLGGREKGPEHEWRHVEAEARRRWAEVNPDWSWMEVSDAIHEAYDQCQLDAQ